MSGLLRRLASQALRGSKPIIYSMARLPYVAPLELIQEAEASSLDAGHPPPTHGDSRGVPHAVSPADAGRASDRIQVPVPDKVDAVASSVAMETQAEIQSFNRSSTYERMMEKTDAPIPVMQGPTTVTDTTPKPPIARQTPAASHDRAQQRRTIPASATPLAEIMTDSDSTEEKEALPTRQVPAEALSFSKPRPLISPTVPTPLVHGLEVSPRRSAAGYTPSDPGLSVPRRAPEPEATEVHVHIGRIEVTAVHEAPTHKAKVAPARRTMSLDEYLARCKGGPA